MATATVTVTTYVARTSATCQGAPTESLSSVIASLSNQKPLIVVNDELRVLDLPVQDGQLLESKSWTVVYPDDTDMAQGLSKLEADFADMKTEHYAQIAGLRKDMEEDAKVFRCNFLENTATQILLFAIGEQPQSQSVATYYWSCSKRNFPERFPEKFTDLTSAINAVNPVAVEENALAGVFDKIITRCNCTLHFVDRESLEKDAVNVAQDLLSRHPVLRDTCHQESFVVDSYKKIKAAFNF
ncbi:hypothetical protein BDZ88DRAFT_442580 [Geranomyces variabilis]|nr:hypothetical protein BDZ88DRAFT_442580 [Geranomyces variabilis]KAJ3135743.1 hypothetical protein HDU90_003819 [Geranomyces variabilis]